VGRRDGGGKRAERHDGDLAADHREVVKASSGGGGLALGLSPVEEDGRKKNDVEQRKCGGEERRKK
jgi:hypothetical protein